MDNQAKPAQVGDFVFFNGEDGTIKVQIDAANETIWLNQKGMAELFGVDRSVITKHIKNIFDTGELSSNQVCAIFAHTADDGKKYNTQFYSLDVIIAVGYRVNSFRATQFRILFRLYVSSGSICCHSHKRRIACHWHTQRKAG